MNLKGLIVGFLLGLTAMVTMNAMIEKLCELWTIDAQYHESFSQDELNMADRQQRQDDLNLWLQDCRNGVNSPADCGYDVE